MRKKRSQESNPDAVFIGWQELVTGSPIALSNVTAAGNPCYGSSLFGGNSKKTEPADSETTEFYRLRK